MKNALILHGASNNSSGNWFPWLKQELQNKGYKAWCPDLPNADKPNQKEWLKTVDCGLRHGKEIHRQVGGKLIIKKGEGHFNLEVGEKYRQFPALLKYI